MAIIGIVMGMGGGIIRDMLLNQPLSTLQSNWYLLTATGAALVGMLLASPLRRLNGVIVGLDAIVIGMFGAFGTSKALPRHLRAPVMQPGPEMRWRLSMLNTGSRDRREMFP